MTSLLQSLKGWWLSRASESDTTLAKGIAIWTQGGWAMIALAVISVFIFFIGFQILVRLLRKRTGGVREATWRRWIYESVDRRGAAGDILDEVEHILRTDGNSVHDGFTEVRSREMEPFIRDLRLMNIAVGAAPLVGLLGTVTGMLATFDAMSNGGGGDKTMSMIAKGISEALYTTETGLMVALPGVFLHYYLSRRFESFKKFLAHAETVWTQEALLRGENRAQESSHLAARELARREIRARLSTHLRDRFRSSPSPPPSKSAAPGA